MALIQMESPEESVMALIVSILTMTIAVNLYNTFYSFQKVYFLFILSTFNVAHYKMR